MFHYLAPYVDVGTDEDPFRPRGSEQPGWSAIDLRPDSTVLTGRALMAVPVRDDTIGAYLGDAPDEVSAAVKSAIESRFGITMEATRLRQMLPELLIAHAREDGTRWRPLRVMRDGVFRIYLDGLWWQARSLAGGTTITESFNTADSATLGPDLTWTELAGNINVVSNQASVLAQSSSARADTDLATTNHYAQLVIANLSRGTRASALLGPFCRKDSSATSTFYTFVAAIRSTSNGYEMYANVGGTFSLLGTDTVDVSIGETAYIEADGSSITGKRNGTVSVGPVTDTAISGQLRTGMYGTFGSFGSGQIVIADSFEAGDLGAGNPWYAYASQQ